MTPKPPPKSLVQSFDPARARAFLADLKQREDGLQGEWDAEAWHVLLAVVTGSSMLAQQLADHPKDLEILRDTEALRHPRRPAGIRRELKQRIASDLEQGSYAAARRSLHRFQQRQLLRIAARDLAGIGSVGEVLEELSATADACLATIFDWLVLRLSQQFGVPFHALPGSDTTPSCPTPGCIMALGKYGGQELNYSSDIDLIFIYEEEGQCQKPGGARRQPRSGMSNHQFFVRLAEHLIEELTDRSGPDLLYRVDFRLRPEGNAGPLARSMASYETYYAQFGQTWERMMLIKARPVAGDVALGAEFQETIQSFRYPRFISETVLDDIARIKHRIETESIGSDEQERNVKLGQGGIRDIEFIVQSLQLLHAGKSPYYQSPQTLKTLAQFEKYGLMDADDVRRLSAAYDFLRKVEHRLQMEAGRQTHTIPVDPAAQKRLARSMGMKSAPAFWKALRAHQSDVRSVYHAVIKPTGKPTDLPASFQRQPDREQWTRVLARHGFLDPDNATKLIQILFHGPGFGHVAPSTTELAVGILTRFLELCPTAENLERLAHPTTTALLLSDPDRVLARLDSYIASYGARALLYDTWTHNPQYLDLLLLLFDRSEYLSAALIGNPGLLDEILQSGQLRRRKNTATILAELREGTDDSNQNEWLHRYHQAELMRITLRDITAIAPLDAIGEELTMLARALLQYGLADVCRRHRVRRPPFAIIGMGKLGGGELTYGSDLDVLLVSRAAPRSQAKFQRMAADLVTLLSGSNQTQRVIEVDARLRPDGESGPLAPPLPTYADYYEKRAMLWEIQALSRATVAAGDAQLGAEFLGLAGRLTDFSRPTHPSPAVGRTWKRELARMRQRIAEERTPPGRSTLSIKTAEGGIIDAEFLAQTICLASGHHEPNTPKALTWIQQERKLPKRISADLIRGYHGLRRIEMTLRRWNMQGESVLPEAPEAQLRVAIRTGHPSAEALLDAVTAYKTSIRKAYQRILPN